MGNPRKPENPLLVLRIGYMDRYDGPGYIRGGGSYITDNGVGGEVYNFKPSRGVCFGYAMSIQAAGINLCLLSDQEWKPGDVLHGVDVIFIARHKERGQVVVGWYRNASVYHKQYLNRRGTIPGMDFQKRHYLCSSYQEDVTLLPEENRTFRIPYAPVYGKGLHRPIQRLVSRARQEFQRYCPCQEAKNFYESVMRRIPRAGRILASKTYKSGRRGSKSRFSNECTG